MCIDTLVNGGVDGATGCPEVFGVMPLKEAKTHNGHFDGSNRRRQPKSDTTAGQHF